MHGGATIDENLADLNELLCQLIKLREDVSRESGELLADWDQKSNVSEACPTALNLAEYLALRRHDLSALQVRLAAYGLSSLGRSEAKALVALDAIIATLRRLCGDDRRRLSTGGTMRAGEEALNAECEIIFGKPHCDPRAGVMATLPSEAATDANLVTRLIEAGMDCARINCAHDDHEAWTSMIANIRAAEKLLGRSCRVLMDIAGPKCRVRIRQRPRKIPALSRRSHFSGREAPIRPMARSRSRRHFRKSSTRSMSAWRSGSTTARLARASSHKTKSKAELEVFSARAKGERLKPEKGMNFPTTESESPAADAKRLSQTSTSSRKMPTSSAFPSCNEPSDVELLQDHLAARRGEAPPQPIVLKIETPLAVRNLPQLILQSLAHNPTAVMIARGDLAVELGFARLSEMQEEILWLCEAAHVPVIWATQVLDQFVQEGVLSRAETTDAAMAQRADCVMLNKGPYLPEGVAFLRDVLTRMDRHHVEEIRALSAAPRLGLSFAWRSVETSRAATLQLLAPGKRSEGRL